ncbi:MAG: DUF971 domain-containing protein [Chlorobi bacterium]|nr:DUF971 domain-containing protein [Chlorobiota bacterium]MCI0715888.1 DUF971 domain-containing protein [Chlorobiota bacterium]
MTPQKITVKDKRYLHIIWEDNSESLLLLANLRKNCPCAVCTDERNSRSSGYLPLVSAAQTTLTDIKPVGTYAIQLYWRDGHNTGIYTYEKLKEGKY